MNVAEAAKDVHMPLVEEMQLQGSWLFRWRTYLPLAVLALFFAGLRGFAYPLGSHRLDQYWELVCFTVSLLGIGIRVGTVGFAPRKTSGRNTRRQVAGSLNTTGAYSVVRNPLYLGNFFVGLGPALFLHAWWIPPIYALGFMVYYERIILAEEAFLSQKFGQVYVDWARKTSVFLPRFGHWMPPLERFNVRRVIRREHQTLFGTVMIFFTMETVSDMRVGVPPFDDAVWNVIAAAALVFFVVVRMLRSFTTVLSDREVTVADGSSEV